MTTFFPFAPSAAAQFTFQPVLDGASYNASVPWLLFGARYYLNLSASDGTQIWYGAIVSSAAGIQLESLSWANGIVTATTSAPHGYRTATTVSLTIAGCSPDAYNGLVEALITGPSSFSYLLASNPGTATVLGTVSYDVNLIGGVPDENGNYFTSILVFRDESQTFEVSP